MFSGVSFNFYLFNFYLKYIPGNVYVNTIVASVGEAISVFTACFIVKLLGPRNAITTTCSISGIATIILWFAEVHGYINEVPLIILMARFGVSALFPIMYMSTLIYFPSRFLGAVFGICNTTARALTILAPMVAEIDTPIPEICSILICTVSVILSQLLIIPKDMKGI